MFTEIEKQIKDEISDLRHRVTNTELNIFYAKIIFLIMYCLCMIGIIFLGMK